jgi:hypothetical protein
MLNEFGEYEEPGQAGKGCLIAIIGAVIFWSLVIIVL